MKDKYVPSPRHVVAFLTTVLTLALSAILFLTLNKRYFYSHMGYDEGFFVWGGWSITKGLVPYKEFLEFKPPFVFLTHALALKLFGFAGQRYRIFFAAFPLMGVLSLQTALIARKIPRWLVCGTVLAIIPIFLRYQFHDTALSDSESIGFTYFLFGLAILLWPTTRRWPIALGTAFLTACILSKEPFLPVVGCTWAGLLFLRHGNKPTKDAAITYVKLSAMGAIAVVVALLLWLAPTGGLKAYTDMAHNYSRIYRDPKLSYCVVLGIFQPSTPWLEFKFQAGKILDTYFNFPVLGAVAPIVIAGWVLSTRRSLVLFATTVVGFLGSLWAVTASNCQWDHYYTMSLAGVVFVSVVGLDSLKQPLLSANPGVTRWVSLMAMMLSMLYVGPTYYAEREAKYAYGPHREPLPGTFKLIAENTKPTDRIFTTGSPHLYVITNRISAVREGNIIDEIMGIYDGDTDEQRLSGLRAELEHNMPKVVVLDPEHGHRKGRHHRALIMPFLRAHPYTEVSPGLYLLK